jgi:hypothetical protein
VKKIACLLLCVTLFFGCADFFEFNLFSGLDPIKLPNLENMTTEEALDELEDLIDSDKAIEKIINDEEKQTEYHDYLEETADETSSSTPEQKATAASLLGELTLKTSGAYDVVQGLVGVIADNGAMNLDIFDPNNLENTESIQELVSEILVETLGAEAINDPDIFAEIMQGFIDADAAYDRLGTLAGSDPALVEGVNMGEVVMNAVLASVINEVVKAIEDIDANPPNTPSEAIGELRTFLIGFIANPDSPPANLDGIETVFLDESRNPVGTPEFTNLLNTAGLSNLIQVE